MVTGNINKSKESVIDNFKELANKVKSQDGLKDFVAVGGLNDHYKDYSLDIKGYDEFLELVKQANHGFGSGTVSYKRMLEIQEMVFKTFRINWIDLITLNPSFVNEFKEEFINRYFKNEKYK